MENPSYLDDEIKIVPGRFSTISASSHMVSQTPKEKQKLNYVVYFTFLMLGMGSLLPTNFFFTPAMFWHERFASHNATEVSWMQEFWQNSLTFVLMGTVLVMSSGFLNIHFKSAVSEDILSSGSSSTLKRDIFENRCCFPRIGMNHFFSDPTARATLLLNYCTWRSCNEWNYAYVCDCRKPFKSRYIHMAAHLFYC